MAKRKRHQARRSITPEASLAGGAGQFAGGGYAAGNNSTMRSQIYFPDLNSRTVQTPYTRKEMNRKSRWIEANHGVGRHFARTIPRLVGPLIPQPATADEKWNQAALEFFTRTQGSRLIHDQAGMENFFTRQRTVMKRCLVDGDVFLGLTTTTTGNARTVMYEAPQVGNTGSMSVRDGWYDGIKIDRYGKKKSICILEAGNVGQTKGAEIDAAKILHCGLFETPQSPRGLTAFVHAVGRMADIREMDNDTVRGIKAVNQYGVAIINKVLDGTEKVPAVGRFAKRREDYTGIATTNVPSPRATTYEDLTGTDSGTVATLGMGQDVKVIHDSRRHPNQQAVIDYFIQDCSLGFGMPAEVMWNIAGITGPAVRFVMRMAEKTLKEMRDNLKEQFCQPYWVYAISLAIKNGQLPPCKDPDFWKCNWIAPSALTIDAGRDSAAGIREIEKGAQTLQDWYGEDGDDWRSQLEQVAKEKAYAAELEKKYKLEPGAVLGERELNKPDPAEAPPANPAPPPKK